MKQPKGWTALEKETPKSCVWMEEMEARFLADRMLKGEEPSGEPTAVIHDGKGRFALEFTHKATKRTILVEALPQWLARSDVWPELFGEPVK